MTGGIPNGIRGLPEWMEREREANRALTVTRRENANPDCRICRGRGETNGYIGPGKTATYACPCTGMASWQLAGAE